MKSSVSLQAQSSVGLDQLYIIKLSILARKAHRDMSKQIRMWVDNEFTKLGYSEKAVYKMVQEEIKKK